MGAAAGPVETDERRAPDPASTPGGAVTSPADEQPAAGIPDGRPGQPSAGPAAHPGTTRGEDADADNPDNADDDNAIADPDDYDELGAGD